MADLAPSLLGSQTVIAVRGFDGSALGSTDPSATLVVRSPNAISRMLTSPDELGLARAYVDPGSTVDSQGGLDGAQRATFDLVARKLALSPGMRLLDIGSGWGGMLLHVAEHYGVSAVGVTISTGQASLARSRVAAAGLADRIEIRLQDYRDVTDGLFDAISSIGMYQHVGAIGLGEYVDDLYGLLAPRGRLLNHAITRPTSGRSPIDPRGFIGRYVFPDGELFEVGEVVTALQRPGSRCATSKDCGSTTRPRCERGSPTSRRIGPKPSVSSTHDAPGSGAVPRRVRRRIRRRSHRRPLGPRRET